jgi:ribosome maturation factor RimP
VVLHRSGLVPLFFFEETRLAKGNAAETVRAVAERVTASRGFELVDLELKRRPGGELVRVYVDKPGGIALDDLQSVSEEVSAILDAEDPLQTSYTLEVSSPGLDRPLKAENDYQRFAGRLAKLSSYEPVDGRRHWTGRILAADGGVVSLRLEKEGSVVVRIPFEKIAHGRLEVELVG